MPRHTVPLAGAHHVQAPGDPPSGYYLVHLDLIALNDVLPAGEAFFVVRADGAGQGREDPAAACDQHLQRLQQLGRVQPLRLPRPAQASRAAASRSTGRCRRAVRAAGSCRSSPGPRRTGYALDYAVNSDLEFHPELLEALQAGAERRPRRVLVGADARPPGDVHRRRRQRRLLQRQHLLLAGAQRGRTAGR